MYLPGVTKRYPTVIQPLAAQSIKILGISVVFFILYFPDETFNILTVDLKGIEYKLTFIIFDNLYK